MIKTCLFLKPPVTSADKQKQQEVAIEGYIKPAIAMAGLSMLDDQVDGLEVDDISYDLVKSVYTADLLIVDADCYETAGSFRLSPHLFYLIALGHSLGNHTILVTSTTAHLPNRLIEYHTLTYSSVFSPDSVKRFTNNFKRIVEDLRKDPIGSPDNPIQGFLKQQEDKAKLEELQKKQEELQRMIAAQKLSNQSQGSIIFRKVNK